MNGYYQLFAFMLNSQLAMNKIQQAITTIIGLVFTTMLTGCSILPPPPTVTDITHSYIYYDNMSRQEAFQLLSKQYGMHDEHATVRLVAVTQNGMNVQVVGAEPSHPVGTQWEMHGIPVSVWWHDAGHINFSDVENIRLSAFPARFHCCSILLYGRFPPIKGLDNNTSRDQACVEIRCDWRPEAYNKILSAFLVLCPNVK